MVFYCNERTYLTFKINFTHFNAGGLVCTALEHFRKSSFTVLRAYVKCIFHFAMKRNGLTCPRSVPGLFRYAR